VLLPRRGAQDRLAHVLAGRASRGGYETGQGSRQGVGWGLRPSGIRRRPFRDRNR